MDGHGIMLIDNHLSLLKLNTIFILWFIASEELTVGLCGNSVIGEMAHNFSLT